MPTPQFRLGKYIYIFEICWLSKQSSRDVWPKIKPMLVWLLIGGLVIKSRKRNNNNQRDLPIKWLLTNQISTSYWLNPKEKKLHVWHLSHQKSLIHLYFWKEIPPFVVLYNKIWATKNSCFGGEVSFLWRETCFPCFSDELYNHNPNQPRKKMGLWDLQPRCHRFNDGRLTMLQLGKSICKLGTRLITGRRRVHEEMIKWLGTSRFLLELYIHTKNSI